MSLDDGLTKLIGGLYEAVYDKAKWDAAIAEILRRSGSRMAVMSSIDLRQRSFIGSQLHGLQESSVETGREEYAAGMYALDPGLNWARANPSAGFCDTAAIIPPSCYREHPFIKWSKRRFGTTHWRFFYTSPLDDLSFGLSLHAQGTNRPHKRRELPLQMLLFENLERAIRLAVRPPNFAADDAALIVVDGEGRALELSARADSLIRNSDPLTICAGIVTARSDAADEALHRAISAAADLSSGELPSRVIRLNSARGKSDLAAIVSHFPPSLNHLPMPKPSALIRLIELDRPRQLCSYSQLFDFSPRQTDIAAALLEGHSIESMSATLGISRNTARNHLQALFRKTRTNRQSDLIRVLARLAGC
jgi:DNA-binding CsgD family transcriptional regulator